MDNLRRWNDESETWLGPGSLVIVVRESSPLQKVFILVLGAREVRIDQITASYRQRAAN
ncbi:hypothetical protein BVRB_014580 [Beta vulgaris subsp. vulgaris]|uniref:Uncharacterized protein n=1 Tax=Beta vulgaris subsp. vulgaris TaxID=3555 RepID=A0A0J8B4S6_BETVV|nr:hypothetical protein BVRB_014580 [Beta vulgaris subsp. vulgaris]